MGKVLLLFIQSDRVDVYVNALTHCVRHEDVHDIYFLGREEPAGREFELVEFLNRVFLRVGGLADDYPAVYSIVRDRLPRDVKECIIRIDFVHPQRSIAELKRRFPDRESVLIDITGCSKHLAGDVMSSYMAGGLTHVCYFELADRTHSREWRESKRTKLYHDLTIDPNLTYYSYVDFSKSEPTISTFERLRAQGTLVRLLLAASVLLVALVLLFIYRQQTAIAQLIAFAALLATVFGFLDSALNLADRIERRLA